MNARRGIVAGIVAVLVVGGFGVWWFVLRDDAPERASLDDEPSTDVSVADGETPDGDWVVAAGEEDFVGYRIDELFGGDTVKKTAVGRTNAVEGTMTIDGTTVTAVEITADVSTLESDQGRRDGFLRGNALETDTFTEATFTLTEPIELGSVPTPGSSIEATATGELTLHGVTNTIELTLEARWNGDTVEMAGGAPIALGDYDIETPDIGGFVTVDGDGEMELELTFARA